MRLQDCLLSCQLCPAFPPGWKEDGAIWLQASIVLQTEQTTQDEIRTQATDSGLSQSEAFPPLSPDHSDIVHEHDVMLPIKRKHVWTLGAFCSDLWLWALGLSCGDRCSVVDRKAGLSFRDIVSISKGKNAFTPFLLLSLLRPNSPCTTMTSQLRRS